MRESKQQVARMSKVEQRHIDDMVMSCWNLLAKKRITSYAEGVKD